MASIVIRDLDPALKESLRAQAAQNGHSMEAEVRRILRLALAGNTESHERDLYNRVRARFEPLGGVELELPPREMAPAPPRFD